MFVLRNMRFRSLLLCSLALLCLTSQAQSGGPFKKLLNVFQTYQANWPVEKAFLHLDKTEYVQGETIWIKSYLVAGPLHQLSDFSRNLYVELVNEEGKVLRRLNLKSEKGLATANIKLLQVWGQGYYYLRAYTEWMKNSDRGYFFNKKIKVHSLDLGEQITQQPLPEGVNIQFYPEGGNLVQGIGSRVAFEVTGLPDKDAPLNGKIYDATGTEVGSFSSQHQGRGFFPLRPTGSGYFARLEGLDLRFPLPKPVSNSAVLIANNTNPDYLMVSAKTDMTDASSFLVLIHTRGYVAYAAQINLRGNRGFTRVDKSQLSEGIAHITLFDMSGKPLAERLAFIEKDEGLRVAISTNQPRLKSRNQARVKLKVTDKEGQPVQGNFSLSAIDNTVAENDQGHYNLRSYLLLQSDLPGRIRNPQEFFEQTPEAQKKLDLLMMVNGWRRFDWGRIEGQQLAEPRHNVERAISLKGTISRSNNKAGIKNGRVFLYTQGDNQNKSFTFTDEAGVFSFNGLDLADTTKVMVQAFQRSSSRRLTLAIDTSFQKTPLSAYLVEESPLDLARLSKYKQSQMNALVVDSIYRGERVTDLGEVTVESDYMERRERAALPPQVATSLGNRVEVRDIPYEDKKGKTPYQILQGKAPGYRLIPPDLDGNSEIFLARPRLSGSAMNPNAIPIVFVDGFQQHWEMIYGYSAAQLDFITVYNGNPGVISFRMLSQAEYQKMMPATPSSFRGTLPIAYHVAKEFYAPRYDGSNEQANLPDIRNTVFWAPMITTNKKGEAEIDFYLPDQTGRLLIDVQGISVTGTAGHATLQIPVN